MYLDEENYSAGSDALLSLFEVDAILQETMYRRVNGCGGKPRITGFGELSNFDTSGLPLAASSFEVKFMKRETSLFLTLGLLSTIVPPIFAQDLQGRPDPVPLPKVIGSQLIAWSELQRPQPIPEPVREPGRESKQPDGKSNPPSSDQKPQNETHSGAVDSGQPSK